MEFSYCLVHADQSGFPEAFRCIRSVYLSSLINSPKSELGIVTLQDSSLREQSELGSPEIAVFNCIRDFDRAPAFTPDICPLGSIAACINRLRERHGKLTTPLQRSKSVLTIFLFAESPEYLVESVSSSRDYGDLVSSLDNLHFKLEIIHPEGTYLDASKILELNAKVSTVPEFLHQYTFLRAKTVQQRAKFSKTPLKLSRTVEIPIISIIKTAQQNVLSLSKESLEGNPVKMIMNSLSPTGETVELDERVKAYVVGDQALAMSEDNMRFLKYECEPALHLLAVVDSVPPWYSLDNSECLISEPGNHPAQMALKTFIHALHQMKKVALVRYAYKSGARMKVRFAALFPSISPECLYLRFLPFLDDKRKFTFLRHKENPVSHNKMEEFVRTFEADYDKDNNNNPLMVAYQHVVLEKTLGYSVPLNFPNSLKVPEIANELKASFNIREPKGKPKKTANPAIFGDGEAFYSEDTQDSLSQNEYHIGTMCSNEEFDEHLESIQKLEPELQASAKQMLLDNFGQVIISLTSAHAAPFDRRALGCLIKFRGHAGAPQYNALLKTIKQGAPALWELVRDHNPRSEITFLETSEITPEQIEEYFTEVGTEPSIFDSVPDIDQAPVIDILEDLE